MAGELLHVCDGEHLRRLRRRDRREDWAHASITKHPDKFEVNTSI